MRTSIFVAATLVMSCTAWLPSRAADVSSLMQNFSGSVGGLTDLQSRKAQLAKVIDDGERSGQLSASQAADFRTQLSSIGQTDPGSSSKPNRLLSFVETLSFNKQLNALASQVQTAMEQHVASLPNIDTQQTDLAARIQADVTAGKFSTSDAASLETEVQHVASIESAFKAETGAQLTSRQVELLAGEISKVKTKIEQQEKLSESGVPAVEQRKTSLQTRISTAQQAGQLGASDVALLRAELAKVSEKQQSYQSASNGFLTGAQVLSLAQDLDMVNALIDSKLRAATPIATVPIGTTFGAPAQSGIELDSRLIALRTRIDDATRMGLVNSTQADDYKQQLDQISQLQAAYKNTVTGMTAAQAQNLNAMADRLSARLDESMPATTSGATNNNGWNGRGGSGVQNHPDGRGPDYGNQNVQGDRNTIGDSNASAPDNRGGAPYGRGGAPYNRGGAPDNRGGTSPYDRGDGNTSYDRGGRSPYDRGGSSASDSGNGMPPVASGQWPQRNGFGTRNNSGDMNARTDATPAPVSVNTRTFADLQGYWAQPYIEPLAGSGVIGGFPDGTFHPNDLITRSQFASIVVHALNLPDSNGANNFSDVKPTYWAAKAIASASSAGLITGFPDGTFKPEDKLTRAQALVVLSKSLKGVSSNGSTLSNYADNQTIPAWAQAAVAASANAGVIVNYPDVTQIRPNALATRGEVAAMMYQALSSMDNRLPRLSIGVLDSRNRMNQ